MNKSKYDYKVGKEAKPNYLRISKEDSKKFRLSYNSLYKSNLLNEKSRKYKKIKGSLPC